MVDIYGISDIGCVRKLNEDYIHWQTLKKPGHYLAVLADGMGGYAGGSVASRVAVEEITRNLSSWFEYDHGGYNRDDIAKRLLEAGAQANSEIQRRRQEYQNLQKMGTTLLVMLVAGKEYWLMHAGDSRCYCITDHSLKALTRDHSLVQELLDEGSITEQEAERAPYRNMLTQAVGTNASLDYSLAQHSIHEGESWLLCSDGLYNSLPSNRILELMQQKMPSKDLAQALVDESLNNNAQDNVSVIVVQPEYNERRK